MKFEDALRIARELRLDESNRHPELHYLATPQDLLAFARQVEAEALEKAAKVCESRPALFRKAEFEEVRQDANLSCARDIRALKEESNAG